MPVERLLLFALALAYPALPGHPSAPLAGLPLGPAALGAVLLVLVWGLGLPGGPPRARPALLVLALLAALKLGLGWSAPPYGLLAEYRAGGADAPVERSTDWPGLGATRVDTVLRFRGDEFPVHFFNDVGRFNYYTSAQPRRDLLPFSARWTGYFAAPTDGRYRFALDANGQASLVVAGLATSAGAPLTIQSGQRVLRAFGEAELTAGLHPIEVRYARPEEGIPWLAVLAALGDAEPVPLAGPRILADGAALSPLERDAVLRPAALAVDAAFVGLLVLLAAGHGAAHFGAQRSPHRRLPADPDPAARLERPLLALFALGALGMELAAHHHLIGRALVLSGGNDWLTHESVARDVLLDGPLLADGKPLGQGQPFYAQPLYLYWLALIHRVLGEGLFGPLFANAALGILANLLVYALARELFGRVAAVAALLLFAVYRATVFAPTAGLLLTENLLIPLVPLVLLLLARAATGGAWRWVGMGGIALGLAALTRTTPLALLLPAALILAVGFRRAGLGRGAALLRVAAFTAVCLLTVSPATIRNYVVSGRPVVITNSAGVNLWKTHQPTARVDLSKLDRHPVYDRLGLDRHTREVLEFVRQDPAGYAQTLLPMGLYAVGVVGAVAGTTEVHWGLLGMWLAYLGVTAVVPSARQLPTWFLHAFVWTHLAQMTIFFSHQYGFRLILPMYVAMVPIVAHGLALFATLAARRLGRSRRAAAAGPWGDAGGRPAPRAALAVAVVTAASLALLAGAPAEERARESFYGLSGDAAIAGRHAAQPDALTLADSVYFVGDDARSSAVAYLRGLAYPQTRWFDGARGMVFPPSGERALYVLPDRAAADFARRCLGDGAAVSREQDVPTRAWLELAFADAADSACADSRQRLDVTFEGAGRILGYDAPASLEPGQLVDAVVRWEPLGRSPNRARPFVRLVDAKGRHWGQAEATAYPSGSWRPGEVALGTARLAVDPTLAPGEYRLELGFLLGSGFARIAEDGPSGARRQLQARGGELRLVSRSTTLDPDALPALLPTTADFGGARLLGATLDREAPRVGDRARLTLFWQAVGRLADEEVSVVVRDGATVVHEWRGRPVDGTYPTSAWKPGEVVRDTWDLQIPASLPAASLELAAGLAPPGRPAGQHVALARLTVQPIARQWAEPSVRTRQEARLGEVARLVGYDLRTRRLKPGDTVELTLYWQALAEGSDNYRVSVQLIAADERVVAQQDAEPAQGRRPTAGWVGGEYVEDGHRLRVPRETPRGRYRLAVALYRTEDGQRLADAEGAERIILGTEVSVE